MEALMVLGMIFVPFGTMLVIALYIHKLSKPDDDKWIEELNQNLSSTWDKMERDD